MKIIALQHLLGELLAEHGDIDVVFEHIGDMPGCDCNDTRNLDADDDWWVTGISRLAIVTPADNTSESDRGIRVKSVLIIGD